MANKFTLKNHIASIEKDLQKAEKDALTKAANQLKREVRAHIKSIGLVDKGDLLAGVKSDVYEHGALVGMAAPAFHALLVEFGHLVVLPDGYSPREAKFNRVAAKTVVAGKPYFLPAYNAAEPKLINTLSDWG